MLSYQRLVEYFGTPLTDDEFLEFLKSNFKDLGDYDVFSRYMTCQQTGVDIGFTDNEGIVDDDEEIIIKDGNPLFSHFIIHPQSAFFFSQLPWDVAFNDSRDIVLVKAGKPFNTKQGILKILNKNFLIDHYKVNNTVISFDYNPVNSSLISIQVRDNNLVSHLTI